MYLRLILPPMAEPVTLSAAKAHLRVDGDAEDALLAAKLAAARQAAEHYTGRSLITQTWELVLDEAPPVIALYRPPLRSVVSVTVDGVLLDPSAYHVDLAGARLRPSHGWSRTDPTQLGGIVIRYIAGYGDHPDDVPPTIREAIVQVLAHWHEHRESQELPPGAQRLLDSQRVMYL